MSATVRGAVRGRGPRRRRRARGGSRRTSRPNSAERGSQAPAGRPMGRPAPRHRRLRRGDTRRPRPRHPAGRRVVGWRRHPEGRRVHPRGVRGGDRCLTLGGRAADRRRPRPAPPPPPAVAARRPARGARLAGPTRRPADPPAPGGRRPLGRRPDLHPGPRLGSGRRGPARRAGDRELRSRGPREARGRRQSRLGRHVVPSRPHRLRRHLPPRGKWRHPHPQGLLRPGLRHRPPAPPRRRPRSPRRPQGQGHRPDHRACHWPPHRPRNPRERQGQGLRPRRRRRLDTDHDGGSAFATGTIEKLGAATLAKIRRLGRPPPGRHPTRTEHATRRRRRRPRPAHLDAGARDAPRRPLHVLRLHPIDARACDLDHIVAYDPDGPPGQTHPDNLACLCRRHHRAKTTGLWRYTRTPDGQYLWHGPHGTTY